jgi:hypothetical protein
MVLNFLLLARKSPSIANIRTGTTAANAITSATETIAVIMTNRLPFLKLGLSSSRPILFMVSIKAFLSEDKLISELILN